MLFTLPGPKKFNNRSGIIYSVVCPGKISWISWKSLGKSLTDERKLLHQRPDFLQLTDKLLFIEWGVQTPYYANDDCVISVVKFLWPAPILYPYLVSQNVVTENLLRHRGEERDGVGHSEAHLFCILPFKQQSPHISRKVVKFPPLSGGVSMSKGGGIWEQRGNFQIIIFIMRPPHKVHCWNQLLVKAIWWSWTGLSDWNGAKFRELSSHISWLAVHWQAKLPCLTRAGISNGARAIHFAPPCILIPH